MTDRETKRWVSKPFKNTMSLECNITHQLMRKFCKHKKYNFFEIVIDQTQRVFIISKST